MLAPAVLYIILLVGVPFVIAILYSLSDVTVGDQSIDWVGLENFRAVWKQSAFQTALRNTFYFTIASQIVVIFLANILATVLSADFHGKRLVRFLILLPWTTPIALSAIAWLWMFDSLYSPIDAVLRDLGLLGPGTIWGPNRNMLWLSKTTLAQLSVLTVHVWRTLPLATVILLAGLTSIPQDIKDAAEVDGASYFRKLFYIQLPLLTPIIAVAFLYGVVFTFTDMTVVYILTRGGPVDTPRARRSRSSSSRCCSWSRFSSSGSPGGRRFRDGRQRIYRAHRRSPTRPRDRAGEHETGRPPRRALHGRNLLRAFRGVAICLDGVHRLQGEHRSLQCAEQPIQI
jgi:ABC-type sugar transport system permease subunit